jgi:hypothetical protein
LTRNKNASLDNTFFDHVIDFKELHESNEPLNKYKIIKWDQTFYPDGPSQKKLLNFIHNGGSLFCGATPWGFLQLNPDKQLKDLTMYTFLRDNFGILFQGDCLWLPTFGGELKVDQNRAKHSHFDLAYEKVSKNPTKIEKYLNTISQAIDKLKKENLIDNERILNLKNSIQCHCDEKGIQVKPKESDPIKEDTQKYIVKLFNECFKLIDGHLADGIHEFPGHYDEEVDRHLINSIELNLSSTFSGDAVSTGFYLPAGVTLKCRILNGELKKWDIKIGSHTDDLSRCKEYKRWPNLIVEKRIEEEYFEICSPFGGLVYFVSRKKDKELNEIKVELKNVVESPFIDLTKPETVKDWIRRKDSPGLWYFFLEKYFYS